jgi:uncharacterized protein (UPF0332 family)
MKAEDILISAIRRSKDDRGLRVTSPNENLKTGHLAKADHNLIVMTDLDKLGHEDWTVIAAYYAMYQAASAILARIGLESKEHAATVAVLEHFFGRHLSKAMIGSFNGLKEKKDALEAIIIEDKYIDYIWKAKQARETVQYSISLHHKETDRVVDNAREFVKKMKLVIDEIDEKVIVSVQKKIRDLKILSEKKNHSSIEPQQKVMDIIKDDPADNKFLE